MKGTGGGEIVQVQRGHILRSTSRKDRHSKVYTAKGPRDRRVRLSAHTAIQFYDVQDRLGYDRPSKAVDWLIKKAKNAIDRLAELPPWNPIDGSVAPNNEPDPGSSAIALEQQSESSSGYAFQQQKQLGVNPSGDSSFVPPSAETQCIPDSMKPFFPKSSETSLINFQNYAHDLLSRVSIHTEDLGLSLHTLQEPNSNHRPSTDQVHFSGTSPLNFEANTLSFEANYPKADGWSGGENGHNRMGFTFNSQSITQQTLFCQSSALSQKEPLQSNFSHLTHAWDNRSLPTEDHHNAQASHHSSISSSHFISEVQVPARIQAEGDPGGVSFRPSSSSPIFHY